MKYDFIEIGTSDFRTLAQSTKGIGISVEPVKIYLDNIPDREGLTKINAAVSNFRGQTIAYYCDPDIVDKYNLPQWLKGCNSVSQKHPTVIDFCSKKQLPVDVLVKPCVTPLITLEDLFNDYEVEEIGFLKIDTEGHDYTIMRGLFDMEKPPVIKKIQFESNALMSEDQHARLCLMALKRGYKVSLMETDTILER